MSLLLGTGLSFGAGVAPGSGPTASPVVETNSVIWNIGTSVGIRIPYPSGISAGDLLLCIAASRDGATELPDFILDTNANWTRIVGIQGADTGGEQRWLGVWWKFADGDELTSVGLTLNSVGSALTQADLSGIMLRISGVDASDPIITPVTDVSASDGESPFDSPSIDAPDYSLVIPILANTDFSGTSEGLTVGNGATIIDEAPATQSGVTKCCLTVAQKAITTGESTGAFTWSGTDSADHFISATVGIKGGSRAAFATPVTDSKFANVEMLIEFGHSAATTADTSANAQTWSNLGGAPAFQFWGLGNGGQFQGGSGALDFGNLTNLIPGANEEFCFEMWVYTGSSSMASGDSYMSIHSPTGNDRCWDLVNWGTDALTFYYSWDGTNFSSLAGANNTLTHGQWNHVCVERDASDDMRLFLNGAVLDSVNETRAFHSTSSSFLVGGRNGTASSSSQQRISGIRLTLGSGATRYGADFSASFNDTYIGWPFPQQ